MAALERATRLHDGRVGVCGDVSALQYLSSVVLQKLTWLTFTLEISSDSLTGTKKNFLQRKTTKTICAVEPELINVGHISLRDNSH